MLLYITFALILQTYFAYGQKELNEGAKKNLDGLLKKLTKVSPPMAPAALARSGQKPIETPFLDAFPIDIVYVIDSSGSIGDFFPCVIQALQDLTEIINGLNKLALYGTNIGIVTYSDTPNLILEMRVGRSLQKVKDTLASLQLLGGGTRTEKGLNLARRMFIRGSRKNSYKVLILITDGLSYPIDPVNEAGLIKSLGVEIYAIPVTDFVNINEIQSIVSIPTAEHIIQTYDYCTFANYLNNLKKSMKG